MEYILRTTESPASENLRINVKDRKERKRWSEYVGTFKINCVGFCFFFFLIFYGLKQNFM